MSIDKYTIIRVEKTSKIHRHRFMLLQWTRDGNTWIGSHATAMHVRFAYGWTEWAVSTLCTSRRSYLARMGLSIGCIRYACTFMLCTRWTRQRSANYRRTRVSNTWNYLGADEKICKCLWQICIFFRFCVFFAKLWKNIRHMCVYCRCSVDQYVIQTPQYSADLTRAQQETSVFKFADKISVAFNCQIRLCFKNDDTCKGFTVCDVVCDHISIVYSNVYLLDSATKMPTARHCHIQRDRIQRGTRRVDHWCHIDYRRHIDHWRCIDIDYIASRRWFQQRSTHYHYDNYIRIIIDIYTNNYHHHQHYDYRHQHHVSTFNNRFCRACHIENDSISTFIIIIIIINLHYNIYNCTISNTWESWHICPKSFASTRKPAAAARNGHRKTAVSTRTTRQYDRCWGVVRRRTITNNHHRCQPAPSRSTHARFGTWTT